MVEISDIKDSGSLAAWLEDQPREVSIWIASRAAARVLPLWWHAVLTEDWARHSDLTLPVLRSILTSSTVAFVSKGEIRSADAAKHAYAAANAADNRGGFDRADDSDAAATSAAETGDAARLAARAAAQAADAADDYAADDADAARSAAHAADSAARCVAGDASLLPGNAAAWRATKADVEQAAKGRLPDAQPLWPERGVRFEWVWTNIKAQVMHGADAANWQFWLDWYDAQLAGHTLLSDPKRTWDMLEQIALIDPDTWDAGPEVVNPKVREIWEDYKGGAFAAGHAADPEPVSEDAKSAMKQRVAVNRDALVVASAGIIDQLGAYKEQVRGMNHLEPDLRDEVLAFIDEFSGKLSELIKGLPASGSTVDDEQAGRLVLWLREYRGLLRQKLAYYGSAENMAGATVPTGVILGATGVGAMLGMPVAGSVVGGLIVNQMKPGQAAKELTKPSSNDTDPP